MAKHKAGDLVTVNHCGEAETLGQVESVHENKKVQGLVDVRIDHPGHKEHGRVITFKTADVKAARDESGRSQAGRKAERKSERKSE